MKDLIQMTDSPNIKAFYIYSNRISILNKVLGSGVGYESY